MTAQKRLHEYDEGVDVAHLLGLDEPSLERDLYELFQAHFERAVSEPSVENFRLCVQAHDAFLATFHEGMQ